MEEYINTVLSQNFCVTDSFSGSWVSLTMKYGQFYIDHTLWGILYGPCSINGQIEMLEVNTGSVFIIIKPESTKIDFWSNQHRGASSVGFTVRLHPRVISLFA